MIKKYNKLVRDNIPNIIQKNGDRCFYLTLSDIGYYNELKAKLNEECSEFFKEPSEYELVDILEIVYSLGKVLGHSESRINELRRNKASANGAFENKIYLVETYEGQTDENK